MQKLCIHPRIHGLFVEHWKQCRPAATGTRYYIYTDAALTVIATPGSINCSRFSHIFSWSFFFCYALLEKETERDRERSKNHHFIRSNERRIRGYVARSLRTSEEEHRESKRGARCIG